MLQGIGSSGPLDGYDSSLLERMSGGMEEAMVIRTPLLYLEEGLDTHIIPTARTGECEER